MSTPETADRQLIPPPPQGMEFEPPKRLELKDINFETILCVDTNGIHIHPQVIENAIHVLPIITWVAVSIRNIIENTQGLDEKKLAELTDEFAKTVNIQLPQVIWSTVFKAKIAERTELAELFRDIPLRSKEHFYELGKKIIIAALEIKVFESKKALAKEGNVNAGQLSTFIVTGGPLSIDKLSEILDCIAKAAKKKGLLEHLKLLIPTL